MFTLGYLAASAVLALSSPHHQRFTWTSMNPMKWVRPRRLDLFLDMLPVYVLDSNFGLLVFTWIVPGNIDMEMLEDALARTLVHYPHFAGRLVGTEGWRTRLAAGHNVTGYLSLEDACVPLSFKESNLIPTDTTLRELHPDIIDPVDCDLDRPPSAKEPLTKIRVTRYLHTNETSITTAFCHALGDGLTFFRFVHMLSQFYCNAVAAHPIPTYEVYFRQPAHIHPSKLDEVVHLYAPHLLRQSSEEDFLKACQESFMATSRVDIHFSSSNLVHLKTLASKEAGAPVSRQDALAAYIVTAINRVRKSQIRRVVNLINIRDDGLTSEGYILPDSSSAGTALLHVYSDSIPPSETRSLGKVARRVGETVRQVKNPEFVRQLLAASSSFIGQMFGAHRQAWWGAPEDGVILNNCYKMQTPTVHFGCPGRARFFVNGSMERYIRIWAGNPTRLADGTWNANEGSADVSFRIEHELAEPLMELIQKDQRTWSKPHATAASIPEVQPLEELTLQDFARL